MEPDTDWRNLFVGRHEELALLQNAWKNALKEKIPHLVAIVAESGLGKTRLVQEFYSWIRDSYDAHAYWPALSHDDFSGMTLNPDISEHLKDDRTIPFLWWAIRSVNPAQRNRPDIVRCAVGSALPNLLRHMAPILRGRTARGLRNDAILFALKTLLRVASAFIPAVAVPSAVAEAMSEVREVKRLAKEHKESVGRGLKEQVLEVMRSILADQTGPPIVIVLDDAHWADTTTITVINEIITHSKIHRHPCLVVATHWEIEWNAPASSEVKAHYYSFRQLVSSFSERGMIEEGWKPVFLHPLDASSLKSVARRAFPGLLNEQLRCIVAKTGGNPLLLVQIIEWLLQKKDRFEGRDPSCGLTRRTLDVLNGRAFQLHDIVAMRFAELPELVQDALGWSTEQGIRFLESVTALAMARFSMEGYNPASFDEVLRALSYGRYPASFIASIGASIQEFKQHVFFEVARLHFEEKSDGEKKAFRKALSDVVLVVIEGRESSVTLADMSLEEREDILLLFLRQTEIMAGPVESRVAMARIKSLGFLYEIYESKNDEARCLRVGIALSRIAKEEIGLELVSMRTQASILRCLFDWGKYHSARRWGYRLWNICQRLHNEGPSVERLLVMMDVGHMLGMAEEALGCLDGAAGLYRQSVEYAEGREVASIEPKTYMDKIDLALRVQLSSEGLVCSRDWPPELDPWMSASGYDQSKELDLWEERRQCILRILADYEQIDQQGAVSNDDPETIMGKAEMACWYRELADTMRYLRDWGSSAAAYRKSLDIWTSISEVPPEYEEVVENEKALIFEGLGSAYVAQERVTEAETYFRTMVGLRRRVHERSAGSVRHIDALAEALGVLGNCEMKSGGPQMAKANFQEAVALRRKSIKIAGPRPARLKALRNALTVAEKCETGHAKNSYGCLSMEEIVAVSREIAIAENYAPFARVSLANDLMKLADAHASRGQIEQAMPLLKEAKQTLEVVLRKYPGIGGVGGSCEMVTAMVARLEQQA